MSWLLGLLITASALDAETAQKIRAVAYQNLSAQSLTEHLKSTDLEEKRLAIQVLGQLQDKSSRFAFRSMLKDLQPETLDALVSAVALTPDDFLSKELYPQLKEPAHKATILYGLGQHSESNFVALFEQELRLHTSPFRPTEVATAAAVAIGLSAERKLAIPSTVVDSLLPHLNSPDVKLRRAVAFALSRLTEREHGVSTQQKVLDHSTNDPDPEVRAWLVRSARRWFVPRQIAEEWRTEKSTLVLLALLETNRLNPMLFTEESVFSVQRAAYMQIARTHPQPWAKLKAVVLKGSTTDARTRFQTGNGQDLVLAQDILDTLSKRSCDWPYQELLSTETNPLLKAIVMRCQSPSALKKMLDNSKEVELRRAAFSHLLTANPPKKSVLARLNDPDLGLAEMAAQWLIANPQSKTEQALWDACLAQRSPQLTATLLRAILSAERAQKSRWKKKTIRRKVKPFLDHKDLSLRVPAHQIAAIRGLSVPKTEISQQHWVLESELNNILGATIETSLGSLQISFKTDEAPLTVSTFIRLAKAGAYDGKTFHRVVPGFVAQIEPQNQLTSSIPDELSISPIDSGDVAMALNGPDSASGQFYIALSSQPHLIGTQTVFATVSSGRHLLLHLNSWVRIRNITLHKR